jgi:hypothetical protein
MDDYHERGVFQALLGSTQEGGKSKKYGFSGLSSGGLARWWRFIFNGNE